MNAQLLSITNHLVEIQTFLISQVLSGVCWNIAVCHCSDVDVDVLNSLISLSKSCFKTWFFVLVAAVSIDNKCDKHETSTLTSNTQRSSPSAGYWSPTSVSSCDSVSHQTPLSANASPAPRSTALTPAASPSQSSAATISLSLSSSPSSLLSLSPRPCPSGPPPQATRCRSDQNQSSAVFGGEAGGLRRDYVDNCLMGVSTKRRRCDDDRVFQSVSNLVNDDSDNRSKCELSHDWLCLECLLRSFGQRYTLNFVFLRRRPKESYI